MKKTHKQKAEQRMARRFRKFYKAHTNQAKKRYKMMNRAIDKLLRKKGIKCI